MVNNRPYTPLPVTCDLSEAALEDCLVKMAEKIPVVELHIRAENRVYAEGLLKKLNAMGKDNPFAPYVSIVFEPSLNKWDEWYLKVGDMAFGSPGF